MTSGEGGREGGSEGDGGGSRARAAVAMPLGGMARGKCPVGSGSRVLLLLRRLRRRRCLREIVALVLQSIRWL